MGVYDAFDTASLTTDVTLVVISQEERIFMLDRIKYSMSKIKAGLLAVSGAALGVVTFRKLRQRNSTEPADSAVADEIEDAGDALDEASDDIEDATDDVADATEEAVTASKHAVGAVKHAGLAAGKALQGRRETVDEVETVIEADGPNETPD